MKTKKQIELILKRIQYILGFIAGILIGGLI